MVKSSDIYCDIDFGTLGRASGSFFIPHSSNAHPFGFRAPVGVLNGAKGPTLTLVGGVHGDEYQGPIVISRLFYELDAGDIAGRVIFLPALNYPAFEQDSRCSPLDGGNMNRAFKTERMDVPTEAIAGWFEDTILPISDAVIDFHAGGKASIFAPVSMVNCTDAEKDANLALANAVGLPLIWQLGQMNSQTSVNAAASRVGVPMVACELGGAGGSDTTTNRLAREGVLGAMQHLGLINEGPRQRDEYTPIHVDLPDRGHVTRAPADGIFEPMIEPGERVERGDVLGVIHSVADLGQNPVSIKAGASGILGMRIWRTSVRLGETLAMILRPV